MPAFWAKAWKNSRTSSVSKVPIFGSENHIPDQKRPAGHVDGGAGQRFVHGEIELA
jgi:hypothetical protein